LAFLLFVYFLPFCYSAFWLQVPKGSSDIKLNLVEMLFSTLDPAETSEDMEHLRLERFLNDNLIELGLM